MEGNSLDINGIEVPIEEDLNMEWYSPYNDPIEVVLGANNKINPYGKFNMPFHAIASEKLNRALGHLNIPSLEARSFKVDNVKLRSAGYTLDTGYLNVNSVGLNVNTGVAKYKANIFFEQSKFRDAIGEKKVNELAMSGIKQIPKNPIGKNLYPFTPYNGKADFEIQRGLHPEYGYTFQKIGGYMADRLRMFKQFDFHELGTTYAITQNPYPYEAICATSVWAADVVNGVHDADYITFPAFWAQKNDEPMLCNHWEEAKNRFYTFRIKEDVSGVNVGPQDGVTSYPWTEVITDLEVFDNPLVPCYYYHQVLKHCFSEHGYELLGDSFIDTDHFKRLYLRNTYSIKHISQFLLGANDGSRTFTPFFIEENTEVNPKNHLPGMTINDFLKNFMVRFSCRFVFKGNKVTIEYNELEKTQREIKSYHPEIEFTKRDSDVKIAYDTSIDDVYNLLDASPFPGAISFKEATYGEAKRDVTIKIPPVLNEQYDLVFYTPVTTNGYSDETTAIPVHLPSTKNPLTGYAYPSSYVFLAHSSYIDGIYPTGDENIVLRIKYDDCDEQEPIPANSGDHALAFYYGMQTQYTGTANELTLPFSGPFEWLAHDPSTFLGAWNLTLNMEKGIIPTFLRLWINLFLCPETITLYANEDFGKLIDHKWNQLVLWRGLLLYIGVMYFDLPLTKMPKYECFRVNRIQ